MRTIGKVKWFDAAKGEGCALSDSGTQAAFTTAMLKPFGYSTIDAGVALAYDVRLEGVLVVVAIHEIAGKGRLPTDQTPSRVVGTVTWFNRQKGYGFVVSHELAGDILLHKSVVQAFGVHSVLEGTAIECEVVAKGRGLHATRILALPPWKDGICKWFSRPKGFGFVEVDGADVFVHMDLLRRCGVRELRVGQGVRVEVAETERGLCVVEIELKTGEA